MVKTVTRKLFASATATTNDLAHIDIGFNSLLVGVQIIIKPSAVADGDFQTCELSTAATGQVGTNDAQNILAMAGSSLKIATNGGGQTAVNTYSGPISIPIPAGTRVFMHTLVNGSSSVQYLALLHLQPL